MVQDVTILVCCHKKDFYHNEDGFLPIQVGKSFSSDELGFIGDNTGDNISVLNPNFCELTAHYWYWKNGDRTKYIGLNHYRRYFDFKNSLPYGVSYRAYNEDEVTIDLLQLPVLDDIFKKYDIVLAKPISYPYSLFTDYCACHIVEDLRILSAVTKDLYPDYFVTYEHVMSGNKLSHYNMFLTTWKVFNDYSKWLFDILFEVKRKIKISPYPSQARVFGYMAERLLNVYVAHKNLKIKYVPIIKISNEQQPSDVKMTFREFKMNLLAKLHKFGSK